MRGLKLHFLAATVAATMVPGAAMADWYEARTDQFVVYSAGSKSQAERFAGLLERYDRSMRSVQNIPFKPADSDAQRVTVFHWGDGRDIAALAGSRASGVRGFYIPRAGGSVAFSPLRGDRRVGSREAHKKRVKLDVNSILLHEYAHHFMFQHFAATYPGWYREGFAEFYGQMTFDDDGSFHLGNPPQYRGEFLKSGPPYPVKRIFETERKLTGLDQANWYSTGWLLVHYLTFAPERQGQLGTFLKLINEGVASMDAAKQAFGDLDKLNGDVRSYLGDDLPGYDVIPANYSEPEVELRKLTDEEEDIIEYRMRSKRGVDRDEARSIARAVRDKASLQTNSPLVALTLAEAEFDAREYDRAEAAARRVIALDDDISEGHLYLARIAVEHAEDGQGDWQTARRHFIAAADRDRSDARPFFEYYMTYLDEGVEPPEDAIIALETAYRLSPYDSQVRFILVRQLAREGKAEIAARLLNPLVFAPHGNDDVEQLRKAMELLAEGKAEEGTAIIDQQYAKAKVEAEEAEEG
ncbi:tetratricopeptide repeat protein [Sphingomicrobium lutaoense]|uniref:Tetratricopeptide (TPR) repeat protein n=1 Tax=Sphingomicrobium lutaoense TaxID=515949 RepID=A0A839Z424_9SPHN|nr:hypothetical protein [Sphingomicrobium lutaoense]MBB3763354.1 tetratricopeptide (TPR) repeat protein [Sphingomicrobium lutaoense]